MRIFSVSVILITILTGANAQVQEQLSPTEKRYQSIVTEPLTIYKGFVRVGIGGVFSIADKMFTKSGKKELIESNASGNLWTVLTYVQYGITDRLQAELQIPFESQTLTLSSIFELPESDSVFENKYSNPTKGFGDVSVNVAYQIIHGSYTKPFLGVFLTAKLPTGQKNPTNVNPTNPNEYNEGAGSGEFSFEPALKFRKIMFPYSCDFITGYKVNLGGHKLFKPTDTKERSFKTGNKFNATASFNVHLNNWIILKNTADISFIGEGKADGQTGNRAWLLTLYPGLTFQLKGLRIGTTVAYPAMGESILANPFYVMNVLYTL